MNFEGAAFKTDHVEIAAIALQVRSYFFIQQLVDLIELELVAVRKSRSPIRTQCNVIRPARQGARDLQGRSCLAVNGYARPTQLPAVTVRTLKYTRAKEGLNPGNRRQFVPYTRSEQ